MFSRVKTKFICQPQIFFLPAVQIPPNLTGLEVAV